ncbi:hypothetical protein AGMMS49992_11530 [Clostridia bacterium]|nr:hypothetical protein AGMMS49992_11530 [Clostridia bacterium]
MVKYYQSARMMCLAKLNGGILGMLPDLFIKACTLIAQIYVWRSVMMSGVDVDMTMPQMLSYAYLSVMLSDLMVVETQASGWLSEGVLMKMYGRPLSVLGQLAAETVGRWIPTLLLFSLPMALVSPWIGVSLVPATYWFWVSLVLCVSLGFAMDFMFACLSIKLRNMNWLVSRIRLGITALFSGAVIPIQLLPEGVGRVMLYQPFASMGGAPLSLFVGSMDPGRIIPLQLLWNIVLWPAALLICKKSQEGMVSYGG